MSNGTAPVCPVSHSQPAQTRRVQPVAPTIPTIPPVHDLRTVINAINQMNNVVQSITRGAPQINNVYPTSESGSSVQFAPPPAPQYDRLTWSESGRNYTKQKVTNPDDKDQYVEIKTLSYVSWTESATGDNLIYKAKG